MLSTPTAKPSEIDSVCTAWAILLMACKPDAHKRFTVDIGTSAGIPAASAAAREIYKGEGGWHVPIAATRPGKCVINVGYVHRMSYAPTQMSLIFAGSSLVSCKVAYPQYKSTRWA